MLQERIEPAWLDAFETVLGRCAVQAGDTVAILCESQSRPILPELARLAAARLKAKAFVLQLTSVPASGTPVIRSTGASTALQQIGPVVQALASSTLVVDCTVEGLMHAPELPAILKGGARVIYVSNEHPEALARLLPDEATEERVKAHVKRLRATRRMQVRSAAGSDLSIDLEGAVVGGNWGYTHAPWHHDALAGRLGAGLSQSRQRPRHLGVGTGRRQPDLQALFGAAGGADH